VLVLFPCSFDIRPVWQLAWQQASPGTVFSRYFISQKSLGKHEWARQGACCHYWALEVILSIFKQQTGRHYLNNGSRLRAAETAVRFCSAFAVNWLLWDPWQTIFAGENQSVAWEVIPKLAKAMNRVATSACQVLKQTSLSILFNSADSSRVLGQSFSYCHYNLGYRLLSWQRQFFQSLSS